MNNCSNWRNGNFNNMNQRQSCQNMYRPDNRPQMRPDCGSQRPCQPQMKPDCGCQRPCQPPVKPECKPEPPCPKKSREELMCYINEVSFAVNDMILYLDTHPCDEKALAFCKEHVKKRDKALREYAALYGPLTIDTTDDVKSKTWE